MNPPPASLLRTINSALVVERLSFTALMIICAIADHEMPTQAQIARSLDLRYWIVRNEVDCSPWIIKHRLDLIRLSITPKALAKARKIKAAFDRHQQQTPRP